MCVCVCVFPLLSTLYNRVTLPQVPQSPEPETPEVFEDEVVKSPEPKPWISLGSEQEIVEEYVSEKVKKQKHHIRHPSHPPLSPTLNLLHYVSVFSSAALQDPQSE